MSSVTPPTPPVRGAADPSGAAAAAVLARGNSVVLAVPPSPAYASALLAAAADRVQDPGSPALLLCPDAALDAWTEAAGLAAGRTGKRAAAGPFPSRAAHHLASGRIHLLVTTPAVLTELLARSAVRLEALAALVIAWPEWEAPETWTALLADLPKDTPRAIVTTDPAGAASFIERYGWRAATMGPLGTSDANAGRFRTASVAWGGRLAALGAVADLTDRDELQVWTADPADHPAVEAALAGRGIGVIVASGEVPLDRPVYFDAPPPALLARPTAEPPVILAPAPVDRYLARVAARIDPVILPGPLDAAERAVAADRRAIRDRIERGIDRGAYATVAPLFDRWPAPEVAAALQALWAEARTAAPAPAPAMARTRPAAPAHPKVWLSAGKKDGLVVGEVFALLADLGVTRTQLGRIEMKDTFTLIEFATEFDAKAAAEKLAGQTLAKRRLTARLDRGAERGDDRPARRGPRRPSA